jgi:hypothetical protein
LAVVLLVSLAAPGFAAEITGKVMSVDPDKYEFVIVERGKSLTFQMDEDAQVLINDEEATLADLRVGDVVSVIERRDGDNLMAIEVRCERKKQ